MTTPLQSLSFIQKNFVQFREGELSKCGAKEKFKRFFSPSYDKQEIQAVADYLFKNLLNPETTASFLPLADAFVIRYKNTFNGKKISQIFDRTVAQYRLQIYFLHQDNLASYEKWKLYGQKASLYQRHPEFCTFMETSGLLRQIKVTRDIFEEIDGEAAIKVDGDWMTWTDFKNNFKIIYSKRYNETFVVHQDHQVYTYLDNGKGLQSHHPFLSEDTPTSILSSSEYAKVLKKAQAFVRLGEEGFSKEKINSLNKERTFVLQLVTSYVKGSKTRFNELLNNPKHPYVRLIIGEDSRKEAKGEVYEVGYGWKNKATIPLTSTHGRFRSPDIWEYIPCEEKIVTNIAVTPQEAKAFKHYVSDYHRSEVSIGNPISFHLSQQNCSTFVRAALSSANINVPTEATLEKVLIKIAPVWMEKIAQFCKAFVLTAVNLAKFTFMKLPQSIKSPLQKAEDKVKEITKKAIATLAAAFFFPFKLALGDAFGKSGRAFVPAGSKPETIDPSIKNFRRWFSLSNYSGNLPGILQKWQRRQASTEIYKHPIKLCIVPQG